MAPIPLSLASSALLAANWTSHLEQQAEHLALLAKLADLLQTARPGAKLVLRASINHYRSL